MALDEAHGEAHVLQHAGGALEGGRHVSALHHPADTKHYRTIEGSPHTGLHGRGGASPVLLPVHLQQEAGQRGLSERREHRGSTYVACTFVRSYEYSLFSHPSVLLLVVATSSQPVKQTVDQLLRRERRQLRELREVLKRDQSGPANQELRIL